ncbi:MAG: hypothetical protein O3B40_10595 [Actinobacteria bacterium]|nr:hypothetical protein [Actinomycetota bacterium]
MKDLEELGRLKGLGLLTKKEFETARREIFSQRLTANDLPDANDSLDAEPKDTFEEAEVTGSLESDIVSVNDETTTDRTENWWQASDGLWYPPESLRSVKEEGWFQDADGQWHPPTQSVVEEPREVPLNQPTEVSSQQKPEQVFSATDATIVSQDSEETTQQHDRPETRQLLNAAHSSGSYDSELVDSPQRGINKGLSGGKKLLGATAGGVLLIVGIVAFAARSNTTLPATMEPVRTALLSSYFGPWEDAQSAFISSSRGAKKWEALTGLYRSYFERGNFGQKQEMSVSLRDDWYVIEYCSVKACEDGSNVFEIHLRKGVSNKIQDLRWFRGTDNELSEVEFYEVRLDPEYLFDDPLQAWSDGLRSALRLGMDFDYAIQERGNGCLLGRAITPTGIIKGEMTIDGYDTSSLERWTLYLSLDARVRTVDGLELDGNSDVHPGILEVNKSGDDEFVFCVDYNVLEVVEFVIPARDWTLYTDVGTMVYTADFVVPFELIEL